MFLWQQLLAGEFDPYFDYVTMLLGIDESGATNLITGASFAFTGGAAVSSANAAKGNTHSILLPSTGSPYVSTAHDTSLVMGSGDFTIEYSGRPATFRAGTNSGSSYHFWPLFSWGSYAAAGQPINLMAWYNSDADTVAITINTHSTYSYSRGTYDIPLNQNADVAIVRRAGMLSFYVNGTRIGAPVTAPVNNTVQIARPFEIGRMLGGSGDVFWHATGHIQALRFTKGIARYDGTSYVVPSTFPRQ